MKTRKYYIVARLNYPVANMVTNGPDNHQTQLSANCQFSILYYNALLFAKENNFFFKII